MDAGDIELIYSCPDRIAGLRLNSVGDRFVFSRRFGSDEMEAEEICARAVEDVVQLLPVIMHYIMKVPLIDLELLHDFAPHLVPEVLVFEKASALTFVCLRPERLLHRVCLGARA